MERQFESPGFYFQWHFLEACNLKCRHCYQKGVSFCHSSREIVDEAISQIGKALRTWKCNGRVSVTGGEPFAELDTLEYILGRLNDIDEVSDIGILSNGTLIDARAVERIRVFDKLHEVQISFDGATAGVHDLMRGEGAFDRALRGLRELVDGDIRTAIMFTASRINKNDASAVIEFARNENVSAITVERYTPTCGDPDPLALSREETRSLFADVLNAKRRMKGIRIRTCRPLWNLLSPDVGGICPVGYSCITIMHDGTLLPCRRLPISLGNIMTDGLFKVWYTSPTLRKLRRRAEVAVCSGCPHESLCGGCRAAAYATSGDFMGRDPLCWKEDR